MHSSRHDVDGVQELQEKLEERDKQLRGQAASLAEMEASLAELQTLMSGAVPSHSRVSRSGSYEDTDAAQLRASLREKNEKISMLTAEFDTHRADFRSTIETLELASTETERVYEKRIEELLQEVKELQDRDEDVESVAQQLKQLEELVQELEEGLEDARRGEAEARGEVEFLRGEVERTKAELRREREKNVVALKGPGAAVEGSLSPGGSRQVEQRDDEIRGLKAIIHSLSSGPDLGSSGSENSKLLLQRDGTLTSTGSEEVERMRAALRQLEREKEELQGVVDQRTTREEELERELEKLRREAAPTGQRESIASNGMSERTATQEQRDSKGTATGWGGSITAPRHSPQPQTAPTVESETASSAGGSRLWCEICGSESHDIIACKEIDGARGPRKSMDAGKPSDEDVVLDRLRNLSVSSHDGDRPAPLTVSKSKESSPAASPVGSSSRNTLNGNAPAAKADSAADTDKWCALCEADDHMVTECPQGF